MKGITENCKKCKYWNGNNKCTFKFQTCKVKHNRFKTKWEWTCKMYVPINKTIQLEIW